MNGARQRMLDAIRADRAANAGYPKSRYALRRLRACQRWRQARGPLGRVMYAAHAAAYKLTVEWVLGIELPPSTDVGPGLRLRHGVGLVVNPATVIGRGVLIRQGVTLGNRREARDCPVIEDDVEIGAGAVVIGAITIGRGARIGPNAVVVKDVPPGAVVYSPRSDVSVPRARTEVAA